MKKRIITFIIFFSILCFTNSVKAASIGISSSSRSTTVGGSITVTVNPNGLIGKFSITSSNPSVISGGTLGDWLEGGTRSYKFTAKAKGTATITVKTVDVADGSGNQVTGSNSITITVGEPVQKSANNYLSSLSVDGATLNPSFKKDTLSYTVELEAGTSKATISANAEDRKSTVTGLGEVEVDEGENVFEIKVTSESGAVRIYNLNIVVKEYDPIKVKINNKEYTVVRKQSLLSEINGYTSTTVKINGEEVPALKSKTTGFILVALKDDKGNQNYYVKNKDNYTLYKEYTFNRIILYPLTWNSKDIPDNYKKTKIIYNNEKIDAYKLNKNSKYALIYGMNVETGEKHIYIYDATEDTLQIYNNEEVKVLSKQNNVYLKIILGLGILSFILIVMIIILLTKKTKKNNIVSKQTKQLS